MEAIYDRPRDYDLEHEGDREDVDFYERLVQTYRPGRILELGTGSGRIAIPLAGLAMDWPFSLVGLDLSGPMLAEAERKRRELDGQQRGRLTLIRGDMRSWRGEDPFDLVIAPCSALTHLLELDDQLAAWRNTFENLAPGGRFVVDLAMANLCVYAESMTTPPRTTVEIDVDTRDPATDTRLLRHKTTQYLAHEQRARIRFLYDRLSAEVAVDRYISDFECHVYYPREVDLLFRSTGFEIEDRYGDYAMRRFRQNSRQMIVVGRRPL